MVDLKDFYEVDSQRFWDPCEGPIGRDLHLLKIAKEEEFSSVLEYGPGAGSLLLNILENKKNCTLVGYDISENIVQNLEKNFSKLIKINKIDQSNKSFFYTAKNDILFKTEDNSIDLCICADVLEHVIDPFKVIREFRRVLKKNGRFILSVPNYGYLRHIIKLLKGEQPITGGHASVYEWHKSDEGWDGMHFHTFTYQSVEAALKTTGFKIEKIIGDSKELKIPFISQIRRNYPSLLSGTLTALSRK